MVAIATPLVPTVTAIVSVAVEMTVAPAPPSRLVTTDVRLAAAGGNTTVWVMVAGGCRTVTVWVAAAPMQAMSWVWQSVILKLVPATVEHVLNCM